MQPSYLFFISSPLAKSLHCAGDQAEDCSICLRCLSQLRRIFRLRRPFLRRRGRCCFCSRTGGGGAGRLFRVPCLLAQDLPHNGLNGGPVYGWSCRPYRLRIICKVRVVENDCIGDILCFPVVRLLFQQFDSCQMDRVTDRSFLTAIAVTCPQPQGGTDTHSRLHWH